ncbi:hypothetical protein C922_02475 [Plasmodium inui San Antonio 1]|uniref:Uncharacterized protein n=1 Tax=Plasmodium inui San Antonio 1 TaxID=1237626 RepID=W7A6A6_9APIC|nr:hypothetical protein C922_02475 [Plasmodium inui San Antonio 1]EUD67325.1 hypothetical protein C922_02475 [Plasmodium inui San Antonio 1]
MSGFKFEQYIQELWDRARCQEPDNRDKHEEWGICRLAGTRARNRRPITNDQKICKEMNNYQPTWGERVRSIMLCKALEVWMSQLRQEPGNKVVWHEHKCKPEETGCIQGLRDQIKCPMHPEEEKWSQLYSWSELFSQNPYERNLRICMDIMTILLRVFSRAAYKKESWLDGEHKDLCQQIYKFLKNWAGDRVAQKIMDEWFTPSMKSSPNNKFPVRGTTTVDTIWAPFFWQIQSLITSVQCRWEQEQQEYRTVCPHLDTQGCDLTEEEEDETKKEKKLQDRREQLNRTPEKNKIKNLEQKEREQAKMIRGIREETGLSIGKIFGGLIPLTVLLGTSVYVYRRVFRKTPQTERSQRMNSAQRAKIAAELQQKLRTIKYQSL